MELISDRKKLHRLAVVFQVDLADFLRSLDSNQYGDETRSEFLGKFSLFLQDAMVFPPALPITPSSATPAIRTPNSPPPVIGPATRIAHSATMGSVAAPPQSMATTHFSAANTEEIHSDPKSDPGGDRESTFSGSSNPPTPTYSSFASAATGISAVPWREDRGHSSASSSRSGSLPRNIGAWMGSKRGREEDDPEDYENYGNYRGSSEEEGEETETEERWGKIIIDRKAGPWSRKHLKRVHPHCLTPCGDSMDSME